MGLLEIVTLGVGLCAVWSLHVFGVDQTEWDIESSSACCGPNYSTKRPPATLKTRRDANAENLWKDGLLGPIIFGDDHDLTESVRRLGGGKCEYVRVTMRRYRGAAED